MKKFKTLLTTICLALLFTTNTNAQDDANCGIVVDGVLVDSIPNWNFDKISAVFPVTNEWKNYDLIRIMVQAAYQMSNYYVTPQEYNKYFSNASLGMITIANRTEKNNFNGVWSSPFEDDFGRMFDPKFVIMSGKTPPHLALLTIYVDGLTISGTKEIYKNGAYVKMPTYDKGINLYKAKEIPYWYMKVSLGDQNKKQTKEVEVRNALPCRCPGKPFTLKPEAISQTPFFIVKSTSGSSNTKTEVKTNNTTTTTKTTVTKTTTTKTSTSSGALTASALKPLDKSKPGYFVEKDGSVITQEGYKKGDARNGEVRVYDEGKLRSVTTYVNDEKNGPAALYYSNGYLEESGNYKADNKDGEWKRYTEAGKLAGTDVYVEGEKQ